MTGSRAVLRGFGFREANPSLHAGGPGYRQPGPVEVAEEGLRSAGARLMQPLEL